MKKMNRIINEVNSLNEKVDKMKNLKINLENELKKNLQENSKENKEQLDSVKRQLDVLKIKLK